MKTKSEFLTVKDHSVSGEDFQLLFNAEMDMLETFPQPEETELSRYYKSEDYISHTDNKRNLLERLYHIVRSVSLKRKVKLINSFQLSGKKILDIGCGTGDFLAAAQKSGWIIKGVEPNKSARERANEKTNDAVVDIEGLNKTDQIQYDVITLWHVLEHLPNLDKQIDVLQKLLKPDGILIIAVPNYKSFDAKYYKSFWAAYDVPRHLWHFSENGIKRLFKEKDMKLTKTLPMYFDSYYVSLLSEKYRSGVMNPFKAFWIGWLSNNKARRSKQFSSQIYIIKHSKK